MPKDDQDKVDEYVVNHAVKQTKMMPMGIR